MTSPTDPPVDLRHALDALIAAGMAKDAVDHAVQIGAITSIITEAFARVGMRCTLVGGSAIEVYAPGIFKSGDIDLVIESVRGEPVRGRLDAVFADLGFTKTGRHWTRGDLLVEVPGSSLSEQPETVRIGRFAFNVVSKESLLAERLAGFKHWKHTAYAQQAIDMIAAFGDDLRWDLLQSYLERESCIDVYHALQAIARSGSPVTEASLRALRDKLAADEAERA